jgi:twitching motility protein PilT
MEAAESVIERTRDFDFAEVITRMAEERASDVHLSPGFRPAIRVRGKITPLEDYAPLTPQETRDTVYSLLNDDQRKRFESNKQLDLAYAVPGVARFRVNCFFQRGSISAAFRRIPHEIPQLEELGLPAVLEEFTRKPRGFVLVTGPTGSGKSTTLAAMIDKINSERHEHILTIEDPIEFVHQNKNCLVNQREVHSDTKSFTDALRAALREDPDVVLIGEMRDLETIESALRIAETGHLTFGTLHTNTASSTINRIIDVFPAHQQPQIRAQLSLVLEGILCQSLLAKMDGQGRAMAMEIMVPNPAIRNLIREDKIHQIYSAMQSGQEKFGMQTFNQALATAYANRQISLETALQRSSLPEELQEMINRGAGLLNRTTTGAQAMKATAPGKH